MHSRLGRTSGKSNRVPLPKGAAVLAPPVEFLPPYQAVLIRPDPTDPDSRPEAEDGPSGLTIDEAIAHLDSLDPVNSARQTSADAEE